MENNGIWYKANLVDPQVYSVQDEIKQQISVSNLIIEISRRVVEHVIEPTDDLFLAARRKHYVSRRKMKKINNDSIIREYFKELRVIIGYSLSNCEIIRKIMSHDRLYYVTISSVLKEQLIAQTYAMKDSGYRVCAMKGDEEVMSMYCTIKDGLEFHFFITVNPIFVITNNDKPKDLSISLHSYASSLNPVNTQWYTAPLESMRAILEKRMIRFEYLSREEAKSIYNKGLKEYGNPNLFGQFGMSDGASPSIVVQK